MPRSICPQELIHARGIDNLMRIEDVLRVPPEFDLPHEFVGLFAVLERNELASEPSVSVFAANRATMFANEQGCLVGDAPEELFAFGCLEVEDGTQV